MSQNSNKVEKDISASTSNKLLVICVDRDNDVGEKAGITTPVIGRDACIEAAQRLALEDPEDADSNSIFAAIKTYEDLISKGYQAEVITVAGVKSRGVQADEKILVEIKKVLEKFSANGAVIVSDGEDDESVVPVIQNVLPVVSVQRVAVSIFGFFISALRSTISPSMRITYSERTSFAAATTSLSVRSRSTTT